MGILRSVCISLKPKSSAENIHEAKVSEFGIVGDIHCRREKKQISILPYELVESYFKEKKEEVRCGRFGENLDVEGMDWMQVKSGDIVVCGEVLLQVTAIGSKWEGMDTFQGERVCTPMEPYFIFCCVLHGGILKENMLIDFR